MTKRIRSRPPFLALVKDASGEVRDRSDAFRAAIDRMTRNMTKNAWAQLRAQRRQEEKMADAKEFYTHEVHTTLADGTKVGLRPAEIHLKLDLKAKDAEGDDCYCIMVVAPDKIDEFFERAPAAAKRALEIMTQMNVAFFPKKDDDEK